MNPYRFCLLCLVAASAGGCNQSPIGDQVMLVGDYSILRIKPDFGLCNAESGSVLTVIGTYKWSYNEPHPDGQLMAQATSYYVAYTAPATPSHPTDACRDGDMLEVGQYDFEEYREINAKITAKQHEIQHRKDFEKKVYEKQTGQHQAE
ncbi:MAG: hypothetical protein WCT10_05620 [Patescibacteria group bacterium]